MRYSIFSSRIKLARKLERAEQRLAYECLYRDVMLVDAPVNAPARRPVSQERRRNER